MRFRRLREWAIERLGGELPEDWGLTYERGEPDYYTEDGLPAYDMTKRLLALQMERNEAFAVMLEHAKREPGPLVDWTEDDDMPKCDTPCSDAAGTCSEHCPHLRRRA